MTGSPLICVPPWAQVPPRGPKAMYRLLFTGTHIPKPYYGHGAKPAQKTDFPIPEGTDLRLVLDTYELLIDRFERKLNESYTWLATCTVAVEGGRWGGERRRKTRVKLALILSKCRNWLKGHGLTDDGIPPMYVPIKFVPDEVVEEFLTKFLELQPDYSRAGALELLQGHGMQAVHAWWEGHKEWPLYRLTYGYGAIPQYEREHNTPFGVGLVMGQLLANGPEAAMYMASLLSELEP